MVGVVVTPGTVVVPAVVVTDAPVVLVVRSSARLRAAPAGCSQCGQSHRWWDLDKMKPIAARSQVGPGPGPLACRVVDCHFAGWSDCRDDLFDNRESWRN